MPLEARKCDEITQGMGGLVHSPYAASPAKQRRRLVFCFQLDACQMEEEVDAPLEVTIE